ncbi:hypothetical protein Tco_0559283 [Tanacetum coccineum]
MHNRHLDRHQNPDKLLVVSGKSPHTFSTFDFEAPDSGLVLRRFRLPFDAKALADDYKLVRVINHNVFIYSLKSDSEKSRIKLSITRFDTNTEKFEEIEGPRDYDIYDAWWATPMVQGGCLHFCVMSDGARTGLKETRIHLWRMVEDGCWNRVVSYGADPKLYDICSFSSLHLMRNDIKHRTLYEVDLKKMQNSGGKEKWCNVVRMDISDQVRYTETFVSPNLYIK